MKKILYLHAGAEMYGADIVLYELITKLDKDKYQPTVLLPNDGPLVKKLKESNIEVDIMNYPILRRKYFTPKGIISYFINYIKYSRRIVKYIKDNGIDIVHINTSAVLEGRYIKKHSMAKIVWHIHEILVSPKIVAKIINKTIAKSADKIICVSDAVKNHFKEMTGREDVQVIYNGVDNSKFSPNAKTDYLKEEFGIKDENIVIGMIGRLNAWKGQKDLLNALELVFKENNQAKGLFVGGVFEGQEWRIDDFKSFIKEKNCEDRVIFTDFRNDSPSIHNLIDIFVLPSTNPDPLPTVVLEAMATAKPIVGYRHGGICEMVKDRENGLLVEVNNYEELAKAILKLVNDEKLRREYGEKSSIRQRKMFSLSSYISNIENVYDII